MLNIVNYIFLITYKLLFEIRKPDFQAFCKTRPARGGRYAIKKARLHKGN